jgi:pimeloyl-ACP methyl ester carboxylesterase
MGFTAWRKAALDRLNAGSIVTQTARGALEYAAAGTGGATVLVVHGRPGGYDQGLVIARALNDPQFRFLAVSRPGYLRTPLETGRSPEDQADTFAALLDVLGVPQAAVVALSAGGPSALQFALRHPGRCWGVVLVSTLTQRRVRPALRARILNSVWGSSDAVGWLWSGVTGFLPPAMVKRMDLGLELVQTLLLYSLRRTGSSNDLFQLFARLPKYPLSEIRKPTLVIHGTADRFVPLSQAEFAASAISQAQLIRVPGAGHDVFFVQHQRLAPQVLGFLKAHAPTGLAADAA